MINAIHAMFRVVDEEKSKHFYTQALGFTLFKELDFRDFKLIYLKDSNSNFEIELTVNKGTEQAYTHGSGYGHLAFAVDDLEALHEKMLALNYQPMPIKEFAPEGKFVAKFFFVKDPDGYSIEVIERSERYT